MDTSQVCYHWATMGTLALGVFLLTCSPTRVCLKQISDFIIITCTFQYSAFKAEIFFEHNHSTLSPLFIYFFVVFLELHPWHTEVPRLGI